MATILALDFDGVVCDAFEECALVTWLGEYPHDRAVPGAHQVALLPAEFKARFRKVRDYSRLLDHFVVAHHRGADDVRSQVEFDALFTSLPSGHTGRFTSAASAARNWFRTTESDFWLDLHTLYPGVAELMERHAGSVAIVTAKDAESVWTVLGRHGLDHTVSEVHGECVDKAGTVREMATRHGLPFDAVTFVDDNLTTVQRVSAVGVNTFWARWGYQTREHREEAARRAVSAIDLTDLARLSV
ncbi:MAG: HAD family hydrolase [Actinomycetota bacterium]|nr:HAD family hydrolase [Actinomycetota bacterium]